MIDISKLKEQAMGLEIVLDPDLVNPPISEAQIEAFRASKSELTAPIAALPVATREDFEAAGAMIDSLVALVSVIDDRLKPEIAKANAIHKSLTGARGVLAVDLEDLVKSIKSKRVVWKTADDARIAREAAEARARAEAEAKRIRDEQVRLAAEAAARIAEEARIERERVAEEARLEAERVAAEQAAAEAAAAELEDPMEALAAAQAIEDARLEAERQAEAARVAAEEDQAAREAEAALALQLAEQAASAPVIVSHVEVATVAKEEGVTWADNWVPEYESEEAVLRALVAAGKIEFLSVNMKAINAAVKSQKSLCNIPGVKAVNKKQERRSQK